MTGRPVHFGARELCVAAYGKTTASKLARKLGISRNVVCGHWHRAKRAGEIKPPIPMTPERAAYRDKLRSAGFDTDQIKQAMEAQRC